MKNKKIMIRFMIVLGVCLFVAIAAVILLVMKTKEYQSKAIEAEYNLESNKRYCFVTSVDIKAGDILSADANVMEQCVYTGLGSEYYITSGDLPLKATVDIPSGTPVMTNMTTKEEITDDLREYEISVANIMTNQQESDIIDIRIMFPNGEDYLVLSKKTIRGLDFENAIFFANMTEEEILRFASATIDAYTISGTRIYVTKYLEPSIQEEAIPDYPVKTETLDLLNSDPNILSLAQTTLNLTARLDLESRLNELMPEQLTAVSAGHGLTDTAQASVITKKIETVDDTQEAVLNEDTTQEAVLDVTQETEEDEATTEAE